MARLSLVSRLFGTLLVAGLVLATTGCFNDPPEQSGVFVTRDAGTSWNATPDLQAPGAKKPKAYPPLETTAVAVSPKDANLIVAGTGDDLFQSTDGGATWENLTPKLPTATEAVTVQQVLWHPTQDGTWFAVGVSGGYGKVLKSTDQGRSVQDVFTGSKPGQSVTAIAIDPATARIYVGDQRGGVFRSFDGGSSWQRVFGVEGAGISALTVSGPDLFAGTTGQGVFRSADGGSSFTPASGNLAGESRTIWSLTAGFGALYAGTETGLFVTRDFGAGWANVGNPLPAGGNRVHALAVSGNSLYFASNAVAYRTDAQGSSFVPVQLKLVRTIYALSATPAAAGTLYAAASARPQDFAERFTEGLTGLDIRGPLQAE